MGKYNNPTGAKEIYRGIMSILIIMSCKCICTVIASSPLNLFWEPISLKIIKWLLHTILKNTTILFMNSLMAMLLHSSK